MATLTPRVYPLIAVDPGEKHCGMSRFLLIPDARGPYPGPCLDQSRKGRIVLISAEQLAPFQLYRELELRMFNLHHLVFERYALYPWLLREQGFSEVETAQCVGVIKYICDRHRVPYTPQDAKLNLKQGRTNAQKAGFHMVDRVLGSGQFRYRGPDFALPGPPHRRDSTSHGVMWATTNEHSPLLRRSSPGAGTDAPSGSLS